MCQQNAGQAINFKRYGKAHRLKHGMQQSSPPVNGHDAEYGDNDRHDQGQSHQGDQDGPTGKDGTSGVSPRDGYREGHTDQRRKGRLPYGESYDLKKVGVEERQGNGKRAGRNTHCRQRTCNQHSQEERRDKSGPEPAKRSGMQRRLHWTRAVSQRLIQRFRSPLTSTGSKPKVFPGSSSSRKAFGSASPVRTAGSIQLLVGSIL